MTAQHHVVAIVPARDMDASEAFYRRLGFTVVSDYGDYRLMEDGRGGRLHLNLTPGWPARIEDNALGLYLYVEDVDAAAEKVRERAPEAIIVDHGQRQHSGKHAVCPRREFFRFRNFTTSSRNAKYKIRGKNKETF